MRWEEIAYDPEYAGLLQEEKERLKNVFFDREISKQYAPPLQDEERAKFVTWATKIDNAELLKAQRDVTIPQKIAGAVAGVVEPVVRPAWEGIKGVAKAGMEEMQRPILPEPPRPPGVEPTPEEQEKSLRAEAMQKAFDFLPIPGRIPGVGPDPSAIIRPWIGPKRALGITEKAAEIGRQVGSGGTPERFPLMTELGEDVGRIAGAAAGTIGELTSPADLAILLKIGGKALVNRVLRGGLVPTGPQAPISRFQDALPEPKLPFTQAQREASRARMPLERREIAQPIGPGAVLGEQAVPGPVKRVLERGGRFAPARETQFERGIAEARAKYPEEARKMAEKPPKPLPGDSSGTLATTPPKVKPLENYQNTTWNTSTPLPAKSIIMGKEVKAAGGNLADDFAKDIKAIEHPPKLDVSLKTFVSKGKEMLSGDIHRARVAFIDRDEVLKGITSGEAISKDIPPMFHDWSKSYMYSGTMGGKVEFGTRQFIRGFEKVLKPLSRKERVYFDKYFTLKSIESSLKSGVNYGFDVGEINTLLGQISKQLGPTRMAKLEDAAKKASFYINEERLGFMVKEGVISAETKAQWIKKYEYYMPMEIADDVLEQMGLDVGRKFGGSIIKQDYSFLKTRTGTALATKANAIELVKEGYFKMSMAVHKLRLRELIAEEAGIPIGTVLRKGDLTMVSRSREAMSALKMAGPGWQEISEFRTRDGVLYAFPKDIAEWLQNVNSRFDLVTASTIGKFNKMWKRQVTALNIRFGIMNPTRDIFRAIDVSKKFKGVRSLSLTSLDLWWKGFKSSLSNVVGMPNEFYLKAEKAGQFMYGGSMRTATAIELPWKAMTAGQRIKTVTFSPLRGIEKMNQLMEEMTRLAERARFDGAKIKFSEDFITMMGRNVTVDFNKMGNVMRAANMLIPFLNPRVQGIWNVYENFARQPQTAAVRATMFFTAAGTFHMMQKGDPDYEKLSPYDKDQFLMAITGARIGEGMDSKPVAWIVGVIPEGLQMYWKQFRRAIDYWFASDPKAQGRVKEKWMKQLEFPVIGKAIVANTPPIIRTGFELMTGYDTWRDQSIVPIGKKNLPKWLQARPETSNIYRAIGERAGKEGMSPALLSHFFRGNLPFTQQLEPILDWMLKITGAAIKNPKSIKESTPGEVAARYIPLMRVGRYDPAVEAIYDVSKELAMKRGTPLEMAKQAWARYSLDPTSKNVKDLQKYMGQLDSTQRSAFRRERRKMIARERLSRPAYTMRYGVPKRQRPEIRRRLGEEFPEVR